MKQTCLRNKKMKIIYLTANIFIRTCEHIADTIHTVLSKALRSALRDPYVWSKVDTRDQGHTQTQKNQVNLHGHLKIDALVLNPQLFYQQTFTDIVIQ